MGGVSGASYQTELTQTGMSVTVDLGQKSGKTCTVDELCTAFNSSFYAKMIGTVIGEIDLREWKLELSYPAAVKGNVGETVRVTNKANLRGVDDSSSEVEYDKVIQGSSGSVSGQSYTLNLKRLMHRSQEPTSDICPARPLRSATRMTPSLPKPQPTQTVWPFSEQRVRVLETVR